MDYSSCSCSTSGDEFGADPFGDLAGIDSFLAPEKLAVAASPTASPTDSVPSTPREMPAEMPGDSVLDYYQEPPQPQPREYSVRELYQPPPREYSELPQMRNLAQQPRMLQQPCWGSQPSAMVPVY